jgi:signal transduction histidine kinase
MNVKVNAGAISQIVSNLIMNSIIHAFVDRDKGQIKIDVEEKSGFILLRYADNGSGISEEDLEQLFEPFFTTKRGEGGSGLGTHLVYNIVSNVLNGKITVQSKLGKGTAYLIKFPKG